IYNNGKFKVVERFGDGEEYDFPAPIGKRKTYYFAQDEVGSIPLYVKTKKLDVKIHDNNIDVLKILVALGLFSKKEILVDGKQIKPISFLSKILPDQVPGEEKKFPKARFAVCTEATGKSNGKKRTIKYSLIFPKQKEINNLKLGANFITYPTALSVKLFIMAMPKIKNRGVFPPECLDSEVRKEILSELKKIKHIIFKKDAGFN
ncbi:MAG: saccharopine dehydrogenase C-terminal domain-containing protein, partial [Nanoarchaeota archaeon]